LSSAISVSTPPTLLHTCKDHVALFTGIVDTSYVKGKVATIAWFPVS